MKRLRVGVSVLALISLLLTQPAAAAPACAGDCDQGGSVTVDELITGIGIALGSSQVDLCRNMDTSGEGLITVDEIVNAVNIGLGGCPSFAGEFFGTVNLNAGRSATIELDAGADGQASALVTISEPATAFSRLLGAGGGAVVSVTISGSLNLDTGAYTLSGSYVEGGTTHNINLSGNLPLQAAAQGTLNFQLDTTNFTGAIARGNGASPTPTPTLAAATPTATANTGGPIDPNFIGTWSGTARNELTNVMKAVRLKIELQGSDVVVTDLFGNLYESGPAALVVSAPTQTTLTYNVLGPPVVVFNLTLGSNQIAGIYSVTTTMIPPVNSTFGLVLTKEVPILPDPRLAGIWSGNISPLSNKAVRLQIEIQGEDVLVTDLLGDLFVYVPSTITAHAEGAPAAITYVCDTGPCGVPNPVVTFNSNIIANGRLVGAYREFAPGSPSIEVFWNLAKE